MTLKPCIEIKFTVPIWKMQIDEHTNTICLELRDIANKLASFSSVDIQTGLKHFDNLQLPRGWQCGLVKAAKGVMIVHGYQSGTLPLPKGITAIDEKKGVTLWENHNINFEKLHPVGIEVYDARIQPKKIVLVDIRTGVSLIPRVLKSFTTEGYIKYPQVPDSLLMAHFKLPGDVKPESTLFVEHNGFRILSLHALKNGEMSQYLQIYNAAGELVYEDIIANGIQKLQPEAFIVYRNELIWIQNRSILKVLHL